MGTTPRSTPSPAALATALAVLPLLGGPGLLGAQGAPPSPEDVLGYGIGERFTDVAGVNRYMRALADASELVSVHPYGETIEGRPLIQVFIASPAHRARVDEILRLNRELTLPETSTERAAEIIRTNPAVVYFSYGVHGNESSSSEAALWTAWDLAAGTPEVRGVLDSVVVVIDPAINPDGRDRYVHWYKQTRGVEPDPDPEAREHREPWPGGRYNHYLFDLNRDWTWMTQDVTRARLATWDRWNPQVHVDFHEMGYTSSYFFFPATEPINPLYPRHILEWGRRIGEGNARAFDRHGWLYYTAEGFDLFYPGYGDSWPALLGAIGMTYEQAGGGVGGLAVERPDGTLLTLTDRAMHHRTSGNATLRTAAEGRTDLLSGFAGFHRTVDEGLSDVLLVPGEDAGRVRALVGLLLDQGIRVERASEAFRAEPDPHRGYAPRRSFPAGTYLVRARQPRGRLALTLLRPEIFLDASYSYDITAWSLPYAYGVEAHSVDRPPEAGWRAVSGPTEATAGSPPGESGWAPPGEAGWSGDASYGYLVRPGFDVAPLLADFLEMGGRAYALADTFTLGDRGFPHGTLFIPRARNEDLDERLRESGLGDHAVPVRTGLTEGGPDLGTEGAARLQLPRLALLGGEGTSPTSFGAHWFFLERRLGIPFDAVNVADVAGLDLARYHVVVAPSGRLSDDLGERGMEALEEWVRAGGTLVAVAGSARELGRELGDVELRTPDDEAEEPERDERLRRALMTREEREAERWAERVPGTILPVTLDPRHPLAWGAGADGTPAGMFVLSRGDGFEPDPSFESVAFFPEGLQKISGVISESNLERLDRSTWLADRSLGSGHLVLFADDPLFRLFWYSGFQPYANAILLARGR